MKRRETRKEIVSKTERKKEKDREKNKNRTRKKTTKKETKKEEKNPKRARPSDMAVRALSCVPCAQTTCEKRSMVKYCSFGFVLDMCGCCFVCGKGPGAACGGQWAWHGRCGRGLECRYPEVPKGDVSPPFFLSGLPGRCVSTNTTISDKINVFFSWISSFIQNTIMGGD